jgi:hypothetical protein
LESIQFLIVHDNRFSNQVFADRFYLWDRWAKKQRFLRNEVSIAAGEGMAGSEPLFPGDGVTPEGERDDVFDSVAFAAVILACQGRVFGWYAVGEIEDAADLLRRMDEAAGFTQQLCARRRHSGDGGTVLGADNNALEERGAIEAGAGGFPLFALELVESNSGPCDGEFGLRFLLFGALEEREILENALERSFGGGFVAVEES